MALPEVIDLEERRVGMRHAYSGQAVLVEGGGRTFEHMSGLRPMNPKREREAMKRLPYFGPRRPDGGGAA